MFLIIALFSRDRYSGGADEWGKGGRYVPEVKRGRVWESNFIADLWGFQPKEYKERGGDNRTTLFEFVDNTMSAHLSEFPVGKYKKAHRHGAGAHIVMLTGAGYSFLWPEGEYGTKKRVEWGRMSMFVPPMQWWHQHFNPGAEPARYLALKPWGFQIQSRGSQGHRGRREKWRRADRIPGSKSRNPQGFSCRMRAARRRSAHADVRHLSLR